MESLAHNMATTKCNAERSRGLASDSRFLLAPSLAAIHEHHLDKPPFLLYTYVTSTRTQPPMPVRYLHGTPRTDLTHSACVHTPTRVCATRRILPLLSVSLRFPHMHSVVGSVGHERERFASLRSRYTGCYNERDVTSGISGANREEEARSVGW